MAETTPYVTRPTEPVGVLNGFSLARLAVSYPVILRDDMRSFASAPLCERLLAPLSAGTIASGSPRRERVSTSGRTESAFGRD